MNFQFTYPSFSTLDDLLNATYNHILNSGRTINSKRGEIKELLNFAVTLLDPRSRTSRSLDRRLVRSKFAEFAWYLTKDSNKNYIKPYITAYNKEESENNKILGGYGPKIFNAGNKERSQFYRICEQIKARKDTKQAYLVLSNESDYKVRLEKFSSPPCTIGLHFIVRDNKLNLTCYMRSNDAYLGLPHDLFCFTMLQEMIACITQIPLGTYTHVYTSMHIYENHFNRVNQYLDEGFFEGISMPNMNVFDEQSLKSVTQSFDSHPLNVNRDHLDSYWNDYTLFANRYFESNTEEDWINMFRTEKLKEIAICSISK